MRSDTEGKDVVHCLKRERFLHLGVRCQTDVEPRLYEDSDGQEVRQRSSERHCWMRQSSVMCKSGSKRLDRAGYQEYSRDLNTKCGWVSLAYRDTLARIARNCNELRTRIKCRTTHRRESKHLPGIEAFLRTERCYLGMADGITLRRSGEREQHATVSKGYK